MKALALNLKQLVGLTVALLALACSDDHVTSPETESLDASAFSLHGGLLFGVNGGGGQAGKQSILYTIDATTGVATAVGPIGFSSVGALDFAADGTLYGVVGGSPNINETSLITIDVTTGAGTPVGPPSPGFNARFDMSFRNSDGELYAIGFGSFGVQAVVGTIDVTDGTATQIGLTNASGFGNGLAFSNTDVLYHGDNATLYP